MWGTAFDPQAVLQFYFDGEKEPRWRINILDFYQGRHPLFPSPLVSYEKRGRWGGEPLAGNCFVPIPFAKSLKISVKGESRFFHIIFEKYPLPADVVSFTGNEDRAALLDSFARLGDDPFEAPGLRLHEAESKTVEPGQTVSLLKLQGASGIIRTIVIEADGGEDFFQKTRLRMRWDGHARWDVQAPPGIFFGSAVRADDMRALPLRVEKRAGGKARLTSYFPMAFWESAEIEWTNASGRTMAPLQARISIGANPIPRAEGTYLTTQYHAGETTYGRDWPLFEGRGTGWLAGVVQSMMHSHYCEGNEHFVLDGAVSPQFNGTGTEDYYLACFWPNVDFDSPFGSVAGDIQAEGGGDQVGAYHVPASYSRFHLEAPLPFFSSLNARIQHGGQSDIVSDYRSLAFVYLKKAEALRRTDWLAVGSPASEKMHGYAASVAGRPVEVRAFPEGEDHETSMSTTGRYHDGGEIRFQVALDPENQGVKIRRRIDQKSLRQKALVYVDGAYAGCWYDGYENESLRWADSDFEISPALTRGKTVLNLRLVVQRTNGEGPFSDFGYEVFSYRPETPAPRPAR
ncbi:MAG: DUF2961 domain-containing protein [Candidatus Aminicenantes bacterium]|nr:DUF2961 domain-containing protein [Candidatus Aminicenantes bacterium]